jgi:hypothetical protein
VISPPSPTSVETKPMPLVAGTIPGPTVQKPAEPAVNGQASQPRMAQNLQPTRAERGPLAPVITGTSKPVETKVEPKI